MKNFMKLVYFYVILFLVSSCEKSDIKYYDAQGSINFMGIDQYKRESDDPDTFLWEKNWQTTIAEIKEDTVQILVKIGGEATDYPRKFKLKEIEKNPNIEIIFPEEGVIEAGSYKGFYEIRIKRPAIFEQTFTTLLTFDYEKSDFVRGTVERQEYTIKSLDMLTLENCNWSLSYWNDYFKSAFGTWCPTKGRFIIKVTGYTDFMDIYYDGPSAIKVELVKALEEYKANPENPPLYDDNLLPEKNWIKFEN